MLMHKAEFLVRCQKLPIEQQEVVLVRVMWNVQVTMVIWHRNRIRWFDPVRMSWHERCYRQRQYQTPPCIRTLLQEMHMATGWLHEYSHPLLAAMPVTGCTETEVTWLLTAVWRRWMRCKVYERSQRWVYGRRPSLHHHHKLLQIQLSVPSNAG